MTRNLSKVIDNLIELYPSEQEGCADFKAELLVIKSSLSTKLDDDDVSFGPQWSKVGGILWAFTGDYYGVPWKQHLWDILAGVSVADARLEAGLDVDLGDRGAM